MMTTRKNYTYYNIKKNIKEAYTNRIKSIGKKVSFVAAFQDITIRRTLFEEASIHTAEMTRIKIALKEIHKKKTKDG